MAAATRDELVKTKLIHEKNVVFVSQAFEDPEPNEADIEDLLGSDVYGMLVQECYSDELAGIELKLNQRIPRITKRYEDAFEKLNIPFNKSRPMGLLLRKMGSEPEQIVTEKVAKRFNKLNKKINSIFA